MPPSHATATTATATTSASFTLRYASTQSVVDYPSQLKGTLSLTNLMIVTKNFVAEGTPGAPPGSGSGSGSGGAHVIQIVDEKSVLRLRFTTDSTDDQLSWFNTISKAISSLSC